MLTAIKTQYGNIPFKSRLEALWAITFDLYDLTFWQYERLRIYKRKMISLDHYTPDFLLHDVPLLHDKTEKDCQKVDLRKRYMYIEIKPEDFFITRDNGGLTTTSCYNGERDYGQELKKITQFTKQADSIIVISGPPWEYQAYQLYESTKGCAFTAVRLIKVEEIDEAAASIGIESTRTNIGIAYTDYCPNWHICYSDIQDSISMKELYIHLQQ